MSATEPKARDLFETGTEPEFVIHDIPKWEDAGDGLVRLYVSSMRGNVDKIEYTVVCSVETLNRLGRVVLMIAGEAHNLITFRDALGMH